MLKCDVLTSRQTDKKPEIFIEIFDTFMIFIRFVLPVDRDGNHVHQRSSDVSVEKEGE